MKLVITGATGLVGSRVVSMCEEICSSILILGRKPSSVKGYPSAMFNLFDPSFDVSHELRGYDSVLHLAAYIPTSFQDRSEALKCSRANKTATLRLAEQAVRAGVTNYFFASSASVYDQMSKYAEEENVISHSGTNVYSNSKYEAEVGLNKISQRLGLKICKFRISSVYGIGSRRGGLVAKCIKACRNGNFFSLTSNPQSEFDLIHSPDAARAIARAIEHQLEGLYNISHGSNISLQQVVTAILSHFSKDMVVRAAYADKPGFQSAPIIVNKKARSELGLISHPFLSQVKQLIDHDR